MSSVPARLASLAEIETALWQELARATQDRHHAWRLAVLATVDGDGADGRTVVLREADAEARVLRFFSDARSPKLAQATAHPQATLVVGSPGLSWQLRLRVLLEMETEGLAVASRGARLRQSTAAQDYLSPVAPGMPLGVAEALGGPPAPQAAAQRGHFALLTAAVLSIDWLELNTNGKGHRRALFDAAGGRWIAP